MARKSKNESGTLLTTFGGALIAVASAKSLIDPVVLMPPITFTYMFISGVVITLLGIYKYLIIPRNLLTLTLFEPKNADFEKDILTYEELPVIRGFCIEEFGEGVAELKKMQQFYKRNSKIFVKVSHVIRKNLNKTTKLIGFYDLLPLTKEAADLFDNDELSGVSILTYHITDVNTKPYALYIGGIFSTGRENSKQRAATLKYLQLTIDEYIAEGVKILYTNPVTEKGHQLVEKNGFTPIASDSESVDSTTIWRKVLE